MKYDKTNRTFDCEPTKLEEKLRSRDMKKLNPRTLFLFRQAYSRQLSLMDLNNEKNPSEDLIFRDIQPTSSNIDLNEEYAYELAEQSRDYLKISVEMQSNWTNEKTALENWRHHRFAGSPILPRWISTTQRCRPR